MKHHRQCLHVSVARVAPESPLWEVCVFWEGADACRDFARSFGSEKAARAFARKIKSEIDKCFGRLFFGPTIEQIISRATLEGHIEVFRRDAPRRARQSAESLARAAAARERLTP